METERLLGKVGSFLADEVLGERVLRVEGQFSLRQVNELLKQESVVVISNHPKNMGAVYGIEVIRQFLSNRQRTGIVMTSKFADEKMGAFGKIVLPTLEEWGIEYLKVYQHSNKEVDQGKRIATARKSLQEAEEILGQPGGVILIYPEGTRTAKKKREKLIAAWSEGKTCEEVKDIWRGAMVKAQPGAGFLGERTDLVLPMMTFEYQPGWPTVRVLRPFRMQEVYGPLREIFGRKKARNLVVDGMMLQIAMNLPEKYQGYYRDLVNGYWSEGTVSEEAEIMKGVLNLMHKARI